MRPVVTHVGALLVGLLLGWLLWGRPVPDSRIQDTLDELQRAENLNRGNEAIIARLTTAWLAAEDRADSAIAAKDRYRVVYRDRAAEADSALRRGDTTRAVPLLVAAAAACDRALSACDRALALRDTAIALRDTALALRDMAIDSLVAATRTATATLARVRHRQWAVGPVLSLTGKPIGGEIDRDMGPVRLSASLTSEGNRTEGRIAVKLRL